MLHFDWLETMYGQLLTVLIQPTRVLYTKICPAGLLLNPQIGRIWN